MLWIQKLYHGALKQSNLKHLLRCRSRCFAGTFLAVTRCSISCISIETVQADLTVKASGVMGTIL